MAKNNSTLLPREVLNQFKEEIAQELGLTNKIKQIGWGEMTSRECGQIGGKIGGNMVKVMIRKAQQDLIQ